jgi:hypothetical protein
VSELGSDGEGVATSGLGYTVKILEVALLDSPLESVIVNVTVYVPAAADVQFMPSCVEATQPSPAPDSAHEYWSPPEPWPQLAPGKQMYQAMKVTFCPRSVLVTAFDEPLTFRNAAGVFATGRGVTVNKRAEPLTE